MILMPSAKSIIAVSGFAGAGKNTVGEAVYRKLGWALIAPTFKLLAEKEGITLMQFQEKAKSDPLIDFKFDASLSRLANDGRCVVSTWVGPWIGKISGKAWSGVMIPKMDANVFSVWLEAPEALRAKRLAGREKIGEKEALEHIRKRDADNIARYKKAYGIDITNHSEFSMVVQVGEKTPEAIADEIIAGAKKQSII